MSSGTSLASVVGVVPGAGLSKRMGRPKALLELGGRTFLGRVVTALADGGCASVVVVVADGDDAIAAEARASGARVIVNPEPGDGPITSLRLAIASVDDEVNAIAYLPLDHALVTERDVAELIDAAGTSGARLTLPVHDGKRGHPAIFHRSLFAELSDPALEGGARIVVHRHLKGACIVQTDRASVVTDIDTPEGYSLALAAYAARASRPDGMTLRAADIAGADPA